MPSELQQAIQAIKAGDKARGRELLADIIQSDLNNELAWLWFSSVANSEAEQRKALEQVLKINPDNKAAQRGLALLNQKLAQAAPTPPAEAESKSSGSLGARLAARERSKPAEPEPLKPPPARPPAEPASPRPAPLPDEETSAEPPPAPAVDQPEPVPTPEAGAAEPEPDSQVSEIRQQFEQPPAAAIPLAIYRLKQFWQTERGKLVIGSSLAGLLLLCVGCGVCGLVFGPAGSQLAAALNTATPAPSATPLPPPATETPTLAPTPTASITPTPTSTSTPVVLNTATVTPTPTRTSTPNRDLQTAQVVTVFAGDQIEVLLDGELYQVKYILVDAPAFNDPQQGTETFGAEALELNRRLVEGQTVTLEKDVSETDPAGRLLRYVYVGDLMVNEELLRQGLARIELLPPDLKYASRLQQIEQTAQAANLGIWSLE
jgi:endonuclease YncB( thermonuclease family)